MWLMQRHWGSVFVLFSKLIAVFLIMLWKVRKTRPDSLVLIPHSSGYRWIIGMACASDVTACVKRSFSQTHQPKVNDVIFLGILQVSVQNNVTVTRIEYPVVFLWHFFQSKRLDSPNFHATSTVIWVIIVSDRNSPVVHGFHFKLWPLVKFLYTNRKINSWWETFHFRNSACWYRACLPFGSPEFDSDFHPCVVGKMGFCMLLEQTQVKKWCLSLPLRKRSLLGCFWLELITMPCFHFWSYWVGI